MTAFRGGKLIWPTVMTVLALPILIGLGSWQYQRMGEKTRLLAQIERAARTEPVAFVLWRAQARRGTSDAAGSDFSGEFAHVTLSGRLDPARRAYVYTVRAVGPGYLVLDWMRLADGGGVAVNRGFVPEVGHMQPLQIAAAEAEFTVTGFVRRAEQPGTHTPKPDRARRIWYAVDTRDMFAMGAGGTRDAGVADDLYIEAEDRGGGTAWPKGRSVGDLIAAVPNRHLEYALTWFGLAAALAVIYGLFVASLRVARPG